MSAASPAGELAKLLQDAEDATHPLRSIRGWDSAALTGLIGRLARALAAAGPAAPRCEDCKRLVEKPNWSQDIPVCPHCGSERLVGPVERVAPDLGTLLVSPWQRLNRILGAATPKAVLLAMPPTDVPAAMEAALRAFRSIEAEATAARDELQQLANGGVGAASGAARIAELEAALAWVLPRVEEWKPSGAGGPDWCAACGAYATEGHSAECLVGENFQRARAVLAEDK